MPNKLSDILKVVKVGTAIASPFIPGAAGDILKKVTASIDDVDDVHNEGASKVLAEQVEIQRGQIEELTKAILALHERLKKVEKK